MPAMRCLPSLAFVSLAVVLISGCASDREVYQTRYVPTSSAYTSLDRARWGGDPEVVALPAKAPALGETHYPRRKTLPPGPEWKPVTMGEMDYSDHTGHMVYAEPNTLVNYDERPMPPDAPTTIEANRIYANGTPPPAGIGQPSHTVPVGDWDGRPRTLPGAGVDENPSTPLVRMADQPKTDFSLPTLPGPPIDQSGAATTPTR
jgi:hypothetical protein